MAAVAVAALICGTGSAAAANDSARRYKDLDATAALSLAWETFPAELAAPAWRPAALPGSDRIRKHLDDDAALVDVTGEDHPGLVESTSPLSAVGSDGKRRPIDLSLRERSDGRLVPERAVVETRLGKTLAEGVRFPRAKATLRLLATHSDTSAIPRGDKLFFGDVGRDNDTDFVVAPLPTGVETYAQLRSERSPEELVMSLDLPPGARLAQSGAGALALDRDGERLLTVSAPMAVDAAQRAVGVTLTVEGKNLVLRVPHRSEAVEYPVLVDPVVEDWVSGDDYTNTWRNNPDLDFLGWYPYGGISATFRKSGTYNNGLYVSTTADLAGTYEWRWKAPGTSAIFRTEYGRATVTGVTSLNEGIRKPGNDWEETTNAGPNLPQEPSVHPTAVSVSPGYQIFCLVENPCGPQGLTPGSMAVFGIQAPAAGASVYLPGAKIALWDDDRPYFTAATGSRTGWIRSGTGFVTGTATDTGLGVRQMRASIPRFDGGQTLVQHDSGCVGDRHDRCHATWNTERPELVHSFTYDSAHMPEGFNRIGLATLDAVLNTDSGEPDDPDYAATTVPVRVDRTGPEDPVLSGPLFDARDQVLFDRALELTMSANDGPADRATAGVRSLEVKVNGVREHLADRRCVYCARSMSATWTFDWTTRPSGDYEIAVTATDSAGNPSATEVFRVTVYNDADIDEGDPGDMPEDEFGEGNSDSCVPDPDANNEGYCGENNADNPMLAIAENERGFSSPELNDAYYGGTASATAPWDDAATTKQQSRGLGIGDQKLAPWKDSRFVDLARGTGRFRLIVSWDIMKGANPSDPNQLAGLSQDQSNYAEILQTLRLARQHNLEVVVSFNKTRGGPDKAPPPTTAQYRDMIRRFRRAFPSRKPDASSTAKVVTGVPYIRYYTPWNEPNCKCQPTVKPTWSNNVPNTTQQPAGKRAGLYWKQLDWQCNVLKPERGDTPCVAVAGDFIDSDNIREYLKVYKRAIDGTRQPRVWAIHIYGTANSNRPHDKPDDPHPEWRFHRSGGFMRAFLKMTRKYKGRVWLTEGNGIHGRHKGVPTDPPMLRSDAPDRKKAGESEEQAAERLQAEDLQWIIDFLHQRVEPPDHPIVDDDQDRITRFYAYSFVEGTKMDVGLIRNAPAGFGGDYNLQYGGYECNRSRPAYGVFYRAITGQAPPAPPPCMIK